MVASPQANPMRQLSLTPYGYGIQGEAAGDDLPVPRGHAIDASCLHRVDESLLGQVPHLEGVIMTGREERVANFDKADHGTVVACQLPYFL